MDIKTEFQDAFAKAVLDNKIDAIKLRSDEKMMLLCMDLYYMGCLAGINKLSEQIKEQTK